MNPSEITIMVIVAILIAALLIAVVDLSLKLRREREARQRAELDAYEHRRELITELRRGAGVLGGDHDTA